MTLIAVENEDIFPSTPSIGAKAAIRHTERTISVSIETNPKNVAYYIMDYIF